MFDMKLCIISL